MEQLYDLFQKYIKNEPIFNDKKVLQANHTPEIITHREREIEQIGKALAPALRQQKPSNLFLYGKTGTGKTLSALYTTKKLKEIAEKEKIPLNVIYINCKLKKQADTEYRLVAQIARALGKTIPITGLPTDEVYKTFFEAIDQKEHVFILILDEIDQLVKKTGDEILYNLTRINSELKKAQVCIVGISNDLIFTENLDPRVKSSLSEEEIIFQPYNAMHLQDILRERSKRAFKENVLEHGVIEKCAAYAAREHGDARRALELLRVAGELAEREGLEKVEIKHIDEAEDKIEKERVFDIVLLQPKQFQLTLYSILTLHKKTKGTIFTGDVYEIYESLCKKTSVRPLTQRRISDIVAELDMLGIINARTISKGRYGRTREISVAIQHSIEEKIKEALEKDLGLI